MIHMLSLAFSNYPMFFNLKYTHRHTHRHRHARTHTHTHTHKVLTVNRQPSRSANLPFEHKDIRKILKNIRDLDWAL
jgi:hypothetical protein